MPELTLYNILHGPEIWLVIPLAAAGLLAVSVTVGLKITQKSKEDEPDDRS